MPRLSGAKYKRQGASVTFEMDGERVEAIEGESIAAALAAAARMNLRRDKAGAPRGIFCGMGTCFECEVSIDGGSPQRACLTKVRSGMRIRSVDYPVSPEADGPPAVAKMDLRCDVFIVGGGPAGLSAAIELAESGIETVLADERAELGGQFFKQLGSSHSFAQPADAQYSRGRALIDRVRGSRATVLSDALVWSASRCESEGLQFELGTPQGPLRVSARYAVIATGAFDAVPAFEGWTLPGVLTTGAAQSLVRSYRVSPGQRVLIAGNGPLNLQLAVELLEGGANVIGVAESARRASFRDLGTLVAAFGASPALMMRGARYLAALRARNVPIWWQHRIARATGDSRVRHAMVAPVDSDGAGEKACEVDALLVGYGFRPSNDLVRLLGCRHESTSSAAFVPIRDVDGRSSIPNVFIVGDCGVMGGSEVAMAEGGLAAHAIASELGQRTLTSHRRNRVRRERHRRFQRHLWSLFAAPGLPAPTGETLICRCERVSAEQITTLVDDGMTSIQAIKHATRVGMGPCQGRYCLPQVEALVRQRADANVPTTKPAVRVPIKPVLIGAVAAEKPEWYGYRPVASPPIPKAHHTGSRHERTHVLVIGAGIIGVSTALYLARAGIDVIVIDQGDSNGGASGANAGSLHLQLLSWDLPEAPAARAIAAQTSRLQQLGIETWLELQRELSANFELQLTGGIALAESEADLEFLRSKAVLERRLGIDIELLNKADLCGMVPAVSDRMIGGTFCAGEGKINPMLATPAILREAQRLGARLLSREAVCGVNLDRDEYVVSTAQGTVRCRKVVNAAGGWAAGIASLVGTRLPVHSAPQQMIVTEATSSSIDYLLALARRHLTMKQASNGNVIIGGGWPARFDNERGKAMTLPDSIEGNLWVAQRVIPELARLRMIRSWATLGVMIDGAPILGAHPGRPGFFNAVGANGFTMGPIMGRITAQLIAEGDSLTDIRPFSLDRFSAA